MPLFGNKKQTKSQTTQTSVKNKQSTADEQLNKLISEEIVPAIMEGLDNLTTADEGAIQIANNLQVISTDISELSKALALTGEHLFITKTNRIKLEEGFQKQNFIDASLYEQLKINFTKLKALKTNHDKSFTKIANQLKATEEALDKLNTKLESLPIKPKLEFIHEGRAVYKEARESNIQFCKKMMNIRQERAAAYNKLVDNYDKVCDEFDACNELINKIEATKKVKPDVVKSTTAQMQAFMPEIKGSAKPVANAKATTAPAPTVPRQPSPETTAKVSNVSQFKPVPSLPQTKNSQYDNHRYVR